MASHLRRDLERLERDLLFLAARAEESVRLAAAALLGRRAEDARRVIDGDAEIDRREVELEEECLKILALHQPVATDLRFVASCLKINSDLERVADLACKIAERALSLEEPVPAHLAEELRVMMEATADMLRGSIDAFVRADAEAARGVCARDDEVDRWNRKLIGELLDTMRREPGKVHDALDLVSVSKALERIADHATNVAEDVVYMVEGEIVRHGLAKP